MLPPIDISFINNRLCDLGEEIQRAFDESPILLEPAPDVLLAGLERLLDILRMVDSESPSDSANALRQATGSEPEILLDHGLGLLSQLAEHARALHLPNHSHGIALLALPLGCWMLRRGTELLHPEGIISAAADMAERLTEPDQHAELFSLIGEVLDGITLERAIESETTNPARPWRILLLTRAIVATRSYQPALMELAFEAVAEHLTEEAPDFFREGMGQIEALEFPQPARAVMQRYFERWCIGQRLH